MDSDQFNKINTFKRTTNENDLSSHPIIQQKKSSMMFATTGSCLLTSAPIQLIDNPSEVMSKITTTNNQSSKIKGGIPVKMSQDSLVKKTYKILQTTSSSVSSFATGGGNTNNLTTMAKIPTKSTIVSSQFPTTITLPPPTLMLQSPPTLIANMNKVQIQPKTNLMSNTSSNIIFSRTNMIDSNINKNDTKSMINKQSPITVVVTSVPNELNSKIAILSTQSSSSASVVVPSVSVTHSKPIIFPITATAATKQMPKLTRFQQLPKETIIKSYTSSSNIDLKKIVFPPRLEPSLAMTPQTINSNLIIKPILSTQVVPLSNFSPTVVEPITEQNVVFSNLFNKAIITGAKDAILSVVDSQNDQFQKSLQQNDDGGGGAVNAADSMINVQITNGKIVNSDEILKMFKNSSGTTARLPNIPANITLIQNNPNDNTLTADTTTTTNGQILLKNKILDNVKRSPRLISRSKSTSSTIPKQRRRRRLPSAPFIPLQQQQQNTDDSSKSSNEQLPGQSIFLHPNGKKIRGLSKVGSTKTSQQSDLNIDETNLNNLCDSLFDSLQCPEKLDESDKSDKSKSLSPIDSNQIISSSSGSSAKEQSIIQLPGTSTIASSTISSTTTSATINNSSSSSSNKKSDEPTFHRDDPWKYIKWNSGIGYISRSNVHFKTNEFDLIEILDELDFSRGTIDINFQKQLNDDRELINVGNYPYICKVCYRGSTSDLCSIECYSRCNGKQASTFGHNNDGLSGGIKRSRSRSRLHKALNRNVNSNNAGSSLLKSSSATSTPSLIDTMNIKSDKKSIQPSSIVYDSKFNWETYLKSTNMQAAPVNLFINPFPSSKNQFEVNMKVEAIDPLNASIFCVCTIVEKLGYRIRLHFDGYSTKYDFWKNADSLDIFPPGWCSRNGHQLQPPHDHLGKFDWISYLLTKNAQAAPRMFFTHLNSTNFASPFVVGLKLEAEDLRSANIIHVATIHAVVDNRVLIHFDGYDEFNDYWADITSPRLHPIDWHLKNPSFRLIAPPECGNRFHWSTYLKIKAAQQMPEHYFCARIPMGFAIGMKLEIVDRMVPSIIRPATVIGVRLYEIKVLYDGWPLQYAYWIDDDNTDIHPINWCMKTNHPIEPPLDSQSYNKHGTTCGTSWCKELGNAKHDLPFHYTRNECPYEISNWNSPNTDNRLAEFYESKKLLGIGSKRKFVHKSDGIKRLKLKDERIRSNKLQELSPPPLSSINHPQQISNEPLIPPPIIELKKEIIDASDDFTTTDNTLKQQQDQEEQQQQQQQQQNDKLKLNYNITRTILDDYGPYLRETYSLWKDHSTPLCIKYRHGASNDPGLWTCDDVIDYVKRLISSNDIDELFRKNEINGQSFLYLTQRDLINILHFNLGDAIKVYNQIVILREKCVPFHHHNQHIIATQ